MSNTITTPRKRKRRKQGFASMNPAFALTIQRKGGRTLSQDRKHMAEIGRRGGLARTRKEVA